MQNAQYYFSNGVGVSGDGAWVVFDDAIEGIGEHHIYVLDSKTGTQRGGTIMSAADVAANINADGSLVYICGSEAQPVASIVQWDESTQSYAQIGDVAGILPAGSASEQQWYMGKGAFSKDATTGRSYFAAIWFTGSLDGAQTMGMWDVANLAAGPISYYNVSASGSDMADDGGTVDCDGHVCAFGLWTQADDSSPTVIVLDGSGAAGAKAGPSWTFVSEGTMESVAVNEGMDANGDVAYYVGAAGCSSVGVCIVPGADAYMWMLQGI